MSSGGQVNITVSDGGSASVAVAGSSTQLVIGCSSSGTVGQLIVTRTPTTLSTNLGLGPLPEASALSCLNGGTVIAIKATTNTSGSINTKATSSVTNATAASPIVITAAGHGLMTGDVVTLASVGGISAANGTFIVTVTSSSQFSLNGTTGAGTYSSGGTVTPQGLVTTIATGSVGTSVPTPSGTPVDTYYVYVKIVNGGTVGTAGITFQVSLDAGRNFGPTLSLGSSTSYVIGSTGITISFAAGTLTTGQIIQVGTTEPTASTSGIQAALSAFQSSQYAITGVGSIHILGNWTGANASTIEGYLDTLATGYVYQRAYISARDASPPAAYGGTAETESAWMSSIESDYSAVSARRICSGAAYWNMPSAFPNPQTSGASAYRRPISWAAAARQVLIPPQRHVGRVKDGSLSAIVVNPLADPQDGFIYHDERINPGLDYIIAQTGTNRFMSSMTRTGLPGVYITNPLSLAPTGSDFFLLPLGMVMDVLASIVHQVGQQTIDDDVRVNANGTIYENDARAIEAILANSINSIMFAQSMISSPVSAGASTTGSNVVVDRTNNVKSTSNVNVTVTVLARGYVLTMTVTIGFQNPNAAS